MSEIQPVLLSIIICERVIFDKISGMPSIINIIQNINAAKYPIRYGQIIFFCEMTDGHGSTQMTIRLVDVQKDERIVFEQQGTIEFKDVQQVATLALNLQGIVFPRSGEYRFQLFGEGNLLGERRIVCRELKLPPRNSKK